MTYEELTAKLKKGEALTESEFAEFGKITRPAERFNEVSSEKQKLSDKVKELEGKITTLEAEKVTLTQSADDRFNEKFKEFTGIIETLTGENKELKNYKAQAERMTAVNKIATIDCKTYTDGATFRDPEYLASLLDRRGVDINDKDKVKEAIVALKDEKPEQFIVPVKSGSGTGGEPPNSDKGGSGDKPQFKNAEDRIKYISENGFDAYKKLTEGE
jgi:predicted nuclease with TOPRIM domain